MKPQRLDYLGLLLVSLALLVPARSADAQRVEAVPGALEGVGVEEKLGAELPLDVALRDERDQPVKLGQLFRGNRPVLLTLNYADCPMLCQLQLAGLVDVLREMPWTTGEEFDVVTISIDPTETAQRAALARQKHLQAYGRPGAGEGWHFLRGSERSIRRVASAVGFEYRYVAERREYAHAAVIMVCTPSGRVSRYLYGVEFSASTLRLSLVEAGEGKVGSTVDRVLLFCFHYDATSGRYGPAARRIMQLAGGVTVAVVCCGLVPYWWRRQRPPRATRTEAARSSSSETNSTESSPARSAS